MTTGPSPSIARDDSASKSVPLIKVLALMSDYTPKPLTNAQLSILARARVQGTNRGGYTSSTVRHWLEGRHEMPMRTYELVRAKLWLVKVAHATLDEVLNTPLDELLAAKWPA